MGYKILVIEDTDGSRELRKLVLQAEDYRVF